MENSWRHTFGLTFMLAFIVTGASFGGILDTKHNLSVSGPGAITAATEDQICIFCHAPHKARRDIQYLWNRTDQTANYIPYGSSTLYATVGQPTGASKLCLSCHDGTIALGSLVSEPQEIPFKGGIRFMPESASKLGTDLSDDHPLSFVYDSLLAQENSELKDPAMLSSAVKLDSAGQLQCTSCHNPHEDIYGKFLVMTNSYSNLCNTCHVKDGWVLSLHSASNAQWNGQGVDPWPDTDYQSVSENGCESCHRPHTSGANERLLRYIFEEDNCLVCHNGNVAAMDIETVVTNVYSHPVGDFTGVHDAAENFSYGGVPKHVECADCHNPHQANGDPSPGASWVSGANKGVSGITAGGQQIANAQYLYEICFKCHAENNVLSAFSITRQIDQLDTRMEFDPGNPSFHPVESQGRNFDVPSLLSPYTINSIISCTDCHGTSDTGGPKGPHGSQYEHILERNYETDDYTLETSYSYDLCYKCHNRSSILNDESFKEHRKHIVNEKTPCSACHDPHGVSITQGNSSNNSHLINFDLTIVQPNSQGNLYFGDDGRFAGRCFLDCHGEEHAPETYP